MLNYLYFNDNKGLYLNSTLIFDNIQIDVNSHSVNFWMRMPDDRSLTPIIVFTTIFNFEIINTNSASPFSFLWNS